ncbi:putative nicotinate-nucleotide adenylyltransferase [Diplonema papillatum]|nr:putative nicotinate-nucleotide adenylyltransferase [Diplonema papillatum]
MLRRSPVVLARERWAVFGGAFDPPTKGHVAVIRHLAQSKSVSGVLVVPSGQRPDKPNLSDKLGRYVMTQLTVHSDVQDLQNVIVSDVDFWQKEGLATYDLLKHFTGQHPERDLSFVIGSDWLTSDLHISTWESSEGCTGPKLVREYEFLVVPRPGYDAGEDLSKYEGRFSWVAPPFKPVDISSTLIRRLIAQGAYDEAAEFVPPAVLSYVRRNGLYRSLARNS